MKQRGKENKKEKLETAKGIESGKNKMNQNKKNGVKTK